MPDPLDALGLPDTPIDPDPAFADRLRTRIDHIEQRAAREAERSTAMPTQTLIPYLCVTDSRAALDFYSEVFGATHTEMFEMDDGRVGHVTMHIGDADMYMADEFPEMGIVAPTNLEGSPLAIVINVDDADEVYAHALAAGAEAERPPVNQHGARSGWFKDPWGHRWSPTSPEKPGVG